MLAEGGVELLQGLGVFAIAAFLMAFAVLLVGKLIRPRTLTDEKTAAYECGEVPLGPGWVQFNLRFYVVALIFLVFDVEIALFYPWAVVYGGGAGSETAAGLYALRQAALFDMLFFFGVIVVGFVYLWRFGYLDWVRVLTAREEQADHVGPTPAAGPGTRPV